MSWFETLTKEGFQIAVRESIKPELDSLGSRVARLETAVSRLEGSVEEMSKRLDEHSNRMDNQSIRMDSLIDTMSRLVETQTNLAIKLSEWMAQNQADLQDLKHRVEALERKAT